MNVLKTLVASPILGVMLAAPALPQDADPPRRAARLGYVGGALSVTPAGLQDSTVAEVNRAFTTGDRFWSGADGRGELQTENAAIRFGGRASFSIQELDNQATLIRLESGTLSVRLHTLAPQEDFEIETPQFTFHLNRLGAYRVEVGEKGDTVVAAVRLGDAEVFGSSGVPTAVPRGKQARAVPGGGQIIEPASPIDQFEAWCVERDRREDFSVSAQYVSRDVPGYADLDEHGTWRSVDQSGRTEFHGMAWFPSNMDPDWAPYRSGHFVTAGLWGMNWVDDASWGFAPLHYGRWLKVGGAWGWIPGEAGGSAKPGAPATFAIRPYYTPALVAWTRFAAGVVRPGAVVGWFPLGPGEAWVPQFPASADYRARVNLSNTAVTDATALDSPDVTRVNYMYRETALTAMGQEELAAAHAVDRQYVRVPQIAYTRGTVSAQSGVELTRETRLGPRGPSAGAPPEIVNRPVVVHRVAPPQAAPAYARQEPVPHVAAGSSSQLASGYTPKPNGVPAILEHSPGRPPTPTPAVKQEGRATALNRSSSQPAAASTPNPKESPAALEHASAKSQAPAPVANQRGSALSNASRGAIKGTQGPVHGVPSAFNGATTKTQTGKSPQLKPQKSTQRSP